MKFRKCNREKQDRTGITPNEDYSITSNLLTRSGRNLSAKAFRIYCVIASYNPSFPGYDKIQLDSGYAREAVRNALDELELKCLLKRVSGYSRRESNEYFLTPKSQWKLFEKPIRPSRRRSPKARTKGFRSSIIELLNWSTKYPGFGVRSSIIELEDSSIIELELDQSQLDQSPSDADTLILVEGDSMRQRCPNGQDQRKTEAERHRILLVQARAMASESCRGEDSSRGENLQISYPS